jgi:hypothetical protein
LGRKEILHKKFPPETSITPVFSPGFFLPFIKKKINEYFKSLNKKGGFLGNEALRF